MRNTTWSLLGWLFFLSVASFAATSRNTSSWPGPSNTGVPNGVNLTPYTGSCNLTKPRTVIDSKLVSCDLLISAPDVVITRSRINGYISSGDDKSTGYSFTLEDSEVNASPNGPRQVTAVGSVNFVVRRSNIYGGNRTANCWQSCLIEDSGCTDRTPTSQVLGMNLPYALASGRQYDATLWCAMRQTSHRMRVVRRALRATVISALCRIMSSKATGSPARPAALCIRGFIERQALQRRGEKYRIQGQCFWQRSHGKVRRLGADHGFRFCSTRESMDQQHMG